MKKHINIFLLLCFILLVVFFAACYSNPKFLYGKYSGLLMGEKTAAPLLDKAGPSLAEELGYSKDDVLLIVHADDIGMHPDQTDGTFKAMEEGMVTSGSVMVPCPDFDRVAKIWKENPDLDLGIHLTLNSDWGKKYGWGGVLPATKIPSLYNADGILWPRPSQLMKHMSVDEAVLEFEAQILKVLRAGLNPTHMDAHYGNYYNSAALAKKVVRLSKRYNLPMKPHRLHRDTMRRSGFVFPDSMWKFFRLYGERFFPDIRKKVFDHWLNGLQPGVHELLIHPSQMGREWSQIVGGFNSYMRKGDLEYWTDPETKVLAENLGIIFIGYRELQLLQSKKMGVSTQGLSY